MKIFKKEAPGLILICFSTTLTYVILYELVLTRFSNCCEFVYKLGLFTSRLSYSIIAASIFYYFSQYIPVFRPKQERKKKILFNIYQRTLTIGFIVSELKFNMGINNNDFLKVNMKNTLFKFFAISLIICNLLSCQEKLDYPKSNIVLYDKPLSVIQKNITGKWKLQYSKGGYTPVTHMDEYNTYAIFSANHISVGNDSAGITLDTNINWFKTLAFSDDSIYVMSYYQPGYSFPTNDIILEIRNDTLVIRDFASDPFFYYYTRW